MTVVIAKKFGEYISIVSDTMITTPRTGTNTPRVSGDPVRQRRIDDAVPGRLKIVNIDQRLTIAYAGLSGLALTTIREIATTCRSGDLARLYDVLRQATVEAKHEVEFIVASHYGAANLRRVWDGLVSEPLPQTCIGDGAILPEVLRVFRPTDDGKENADTFRADFLNVFTNNRIHLGTGVGGFPLCLEAGPDGHVYKRHHFHFTWKPIVFIPGVTIYEDENDLQTGDWSFHHAAIASDAPAAAVIGVAVPQAKVGFIYSPLTMDDPVKVDLLERDLPWTQYERQMYDQLGWHVEEMAGQVRAWRAARS
ncbi:hypothetical protein ACFOD4_19410 [Pseudoroseomonas globiformis]|uniref:Uncharacterized protein n=1 Tax=Teichococcus globiformis TaxID=2307229 RepID=A0ABV7G9E6_9PROT